MKSIARKCIAGLMLVAALVVTVQLAAQRQPEGSTSADAGTANPLPFVNQPLVPDATMPGGPGFTLTVNGTGFVSTSVVKWNGSARTTTFVSQSQLKATIPASDIATAHTASVTVVSPPPGGGNSNTVFFEVITPIPSISLGTSLFSAGSVPLSVAVGDFNGDGKLDLVVTNGASDNISVLLGNGDGTFRAAVNYGTGGIPSSVAVGDFNGDGKLDLAVSNYGSNNVSVLLGNGDGTFRAAVNYGTGGTPSSVAVGDFNGDGKLDLAVSNYGSHNVSVLLGNGDGTFQARKDYGTGTGPNSVAVGDFNNDGKLDLVVTNGTSDNISVLLGYGDGTFQTAVNLYIYFNVPYAVAVYDFNGDGKLDLVVATAGSHYSSNILVLLGNGDGTFQSGFSDGSGANPVALSVGDFNGDGNLDLVAASSDNTAGVLLGGGNGTFLTFPAGPGPNGVAVGDFNGDGKLDLAVADSGSTTVAVLLQTPNVVSGPNATLSPNNLIFATQVVNTTSPAQSVTLTNYGTIALLITAVGTGGDFSQSNTCGQSLLPLAVCGESLDTCTK